MDLPSTPLFEPLTNNDLLTLRALVNMGTNRIQKEVYVRWKTTNVTVSENVIEIAQHVNENIKISCELTENGVQEMENEVCTESIGDQGRIGMIDKITKSFQEIGSGVKIKTSMSTVSLSEQISSQSSQQYTDYCDTFSEFAVCMSNICSILKEVEMEKRTGENVNGDGRGEARTIIRKDFGE